MRYFAMRQPRILVEVDDHRLGVWPHRRTGGPQRVAALKRVSALYTHSAPTASSCMDIEFPVNRYGLDLILRLCLDLREFNGRFATGGTRWQRSLILHVKGLWRLAMGMTTMRVPCFTTWLFRIRLGRSLRVRRMGAMLLALQTFDYLP